MTTIAMTTTRLPLCFTLGTATTVALFWFMWTMITGPVSFTDGPKGIKVDFTRLIIDTAPVPTEIGKPEPPAPIPEPWHRTFTEPGPGEGSGHITRVPAPPIDVRTTTLAPRSLDGEPTALVRPQPEYPAGPASRNIEGWVMIEFTVAASGAVTDPHVVDAEPSGVFDAAALKAIARWKYNPRVVNGAPVEHRGMRVVIRFDLED